MKRRGVIGYGAHTGGSNGDNPYQNSHLSTRHSGMVTHDDRNFQMLQYTSGKAFSQVRDIIINVNLSLVCISSNGRHLYVGSASARRIYYYKLHTPFDISDRTFVNSRYDSDWSGIHGMEIDENGEYFFLTDYNDRVHTYQMVEPYNIIGTVRIAGRTTVNLHGNAIGYDDYPTGVAIKPDGTSFYYIGYRNDRVCQFNLSTPFDLTSTISLPGQHYVGNEDGSPFGLYFKPDGTAFWTIGKGSSPSKVYKYTLSTAWDITTASYDTVWEISPDDNSTYDWFCLMFSNDGTKFHLAGKRGQIYRYDVGTAWDLTSTLTNGGFMSWSIDYNQDVYGMAFNGDGTQLIAVSSASTDLLVVKELSTPYDTTTASTATGTSGYAVLSEDFNKIYQPRGIAVGGVGGSSHVLLINDDNTNNLTMHNLQTHNKLDSIRLPTFYVNRLQGGNELPVEMSFKYDGKVAYVFDEQDEIIYQYNLKYPFVLNMICMSSGGASGQMDQSSQDYNAMTWSPDGRYVFLSSLAYKRLYSFELVTPWDVTDGFVTSGGIGIGRQGCEFYQYETSPKGMYMAKNGASIFIVGESNDDLVELSLNF
tara:strand:+ start:117 stop:1886 length:1770 start_codon:yes stop_codon:yes gene_type:complete